MTREPGRAPPRHAHGDLTSLASNQSILKEISPRCSLEGLMLKLKLQYFGHLMRRADSLGKTLMLGKIEGRRRRGRQSNLHSLELYIGEGNGTPLQYSCLENPVDGGAWWAAVHGVTRSRQKHQFFGTQPSSQSNSHIHT